MAEWSKAFDSSSNLARGVGSNPTRCIATKCIHKHNSVDRPDREGGKRGEEANRFGIFFPPGPLKSKLAEFFILNKKTTINRTFGSLFLVFDGNVSDGR